MARSSETLTQTEVENWNRFCTKRNIINDGSEESKRFSNMIGEFVAITWGEDLTEQTLEIALQKFQEAGHTIPFKSAARIAFDRVADQCDPQLLKDFAAWIDRQKDFVSQGDQGFENAAHLLAELRSQGQAFTPDAARAAFGRLQYKGVNIHFAEAPKSDRPPEFRAGLKNHAANASEHKSGVLFAKEDIDDRPYYERFGHKADPVPETPAAIESRWQAKADGVRGATHSITEQARKVFVTRQGTSQIDWEATYAARSRFVGADRSVR
jgi:hypothetical protein